MPAPFAFDILDWRSMTAVVNEIKSPNNFLQNLLFTDHESVETETVAIDKWVGKRKMAPFVKKNGEAILVGGIQQSSIEVQPPNIRLKIPTTPSQQAFHRTPGSPVYVTAQQQLAGISERQARDLQKLADYVTENTEWLCSQALLGKITYSVDKEDSFEIDFQRPAGFTITLAGADVWSTGTQDIVGDFNDIMKLQNDEGHTTTMALMGSNAAALFLKDATVKALLDNRRFDPGEVSLRRPFIEAGARFLGVFNSIEIWVYSRSTVDSSGNTVKFIGDNVVQFVARAPGSEFKLYFGAIPDFGAGASGLFVGERFSKSWLNEDPSGMFALIHSRPLPCLRRPEATATLIVA